MDLFASSSAFSRSTVGGVMRSSSELSCLSPPMACSGEERRELFRPLAESDIQARNSFHVMYSPNHLTLYESSLKYHEKAGSSLPPGRVFRDSMSDSGQLLGFPVQVSTEVTGGHRHQAPGRFLSCIGTLRHLLRAQDHDSSKDYLCRRKVDVSPPPWCVRSCIE